MKYLHIVTANTHDDIYIFTNKGRVFKTKAYELPEGVPPSQRTGHGQYHKYRAG